MAAHLQLPLALALHCYFKLPMTTVTLCHLLEALLGLLDLNLVCEHHIYLHARVATVRSGAVPAFIDMHVYVMCACGWAPR